MHAWVNAWKILAPWKFSSVLESPGLFNLSIRPLSREKKKKTRDVVFMNVELSSSGHVEWRGIEWKEVGPWNWKSDWHFFFLFFFFSSTFYYSFALYRRSSLDIYYRNYEQNFISHFERKGYIYICNLTCLLRDLHHFNQSRSFYSFHFFKKNLKKILWAIHQSLLLHVLSVKWWKRIVFWKRNFGKKILGEKRGGGKNLSIRVFWHIVNHNVSTWPQQ